MRVSNAVYRTAQMRRVTPSPIIADHVQYRESTVVVILTAARRPAPTANPINTHVHITGMVRSIRASSVVTNAGTAFRNRRV